jgi:phospholipase D1/2
MDGKDFEANWFAATLRRFLWREHLGLIPPQATDGSEDPNAQPVGDVPNNPVEDEQFEAVADPLNDELWKMWTGQADKNTVLYRDLFHADPDDSILTFDDYNNFLTAKGANNRKHGHIFDHDKTSDEDIKKMLGEIRGHLVWMPLEFLKDAQMAERGLGLNVMTDSLYT